MPPKDKYANPELRDQIKKEIHESDKGGAPGQWSARKAQMMAKEYKDRGGEYNTDPKEKDDSQKNLTNWGEEEWQTKEGSGHAKKEDGTEKRYLPKKAWEKMSDKEKEETDQKKQNESKEGKQHVSNTPKAKSKRKEAVQEKGEADGKQNNSAEDNDEGDEEENLVEDDEEGDEEGEDDGDFEEGDADEAEDDEDGEGESDDDGEGNGEEGEKDAKAGDKRKAKNQSNGSTKKQKGNAPPGKVGSKHMDDKEPAPRGSADRLPKKGQKIHWKAMPGIVDGEVTEVLTNGKQVDGKSVKASKNDPKIVMESSSSGKVCVHKPEACFYD